MKERRKYNVYIRQIIYDYTDDPRMFINREKFAGSTMAVSTKQAETNVRFRNGDKVNAEYMDSQEIYYHAIPASEDTADKHNDFIRF